MPNIVMKNKIFDYIWLIWEYCWLIILTIAFIIFITKSWHWKIDSKPRPLKLYYSIVINLTKMKLISYSIIYCTIIVEYSVYALCYFAIIAHNYYIL